MNLEPPPLRVFALAAVLAAVAAAPSFAVDADVSSATLTLSRVLERIAAENPELAASRAALDAARRRLAQAGTPDKPRLDVERMYAPAGGSLLNDAKEKNIAVTQEMPFPMTLYLQRKSAAQDVDIAEQAYQAKAREVSARAEQAYASWFLSNRTLEIFNENVEILRRFSKVAESRYAAGHSSQLDALKAQTELTRMLNMVVVVDRERRTDEAMLAALMNRDPGAALGVPSDPNPGRLDLEFGRLEADAQAGRPELRQAALEARKAATVLSTARSELLPDLMLQFRYRRSPAEGDSRDAVLGFSLPLWFWRPAAKISEARAEKTRAEAELQAMRVGTSADVKTAWLRAETAQRLADIYQTTLLPQAQAASRVAEAGYQAGDNTFLDLLDAQRSLLNYRLEYFQGLAEYEQRLADLERVVGKELRKP